MIDDIVPGRVAGVGRVDQQLGPGDAERAQIALLGSPVPDHPGPEPAAEDQREERQVENTGDHRDGAGGQHPP